jgi:hypothetical protein
MTSAKAVRCPECSRTIALQPGDEDAAWCEHCRRTVNIAASPAEQLFYPPGFSQKRKAEQAPASAPQEEAPRAAVASDRYPPGHRGKNAERKPASLAEALIGAPDPSPAEELLPPQVELPPGDSEPAEAQAVDALLPQAVEAPIVSETPPVVDAPKTEPLPGVVDDRSRLTKESGMSPRQIGNLLIWAICTVLLALTLWFLLSR